MTANKELKDDIQKIKTMLTAINLKLKLLLNQSAQTTNEAALACIRKDLTSAIENYVNSDIKENLEKNMTQICEKREVCKTVLSNFLQKNTGLIRRQNLSETLIQKRRDDLAKLRQDNEVKAECAKCFDEAEKLFEKQLLLFNSMNIYNFDKEPRENIANIPEQALVDSVLEPIANVKRLQILKSLAIKEQTFSDFIELTGLYGGNLLFHLQKLLDAGMIIQRHERGDYMITDKGYAILKLIASIYKIVTSKNNEQTLIAK